MKEITIDGIEYTLTLKQQTEQEFNYPMWFKSKDYGHVIKFSSLTEGIVVKGNYEYHIGYKISDWTKHTNTEIWEQVEDPNKLQDKDAIWCWDDGDITMRIVKFWDARYKSTFDYKGTREGSPFDNYEKIQPEDEPKWVKEARELLEY